MSVGPDPNVNVHLIEETRKQINRLFEEVARLSEADLAPPDFYGELLKRVLTALVAPAGAVWVKTPQGNLQLQYQINAAQVGTDKTEETRAEHSELLRQAFQQGRPLSLLPHASAGKADGGGTAPGNPTDFICLIAPILVDKQAAGLIEVWQSHNRHPDAVQGFLQFLVRMAELASMYTRNHLLRQMGGQQQLWTQLEAFARQVHGSLNPTEVAYTTANEGRRIIEVDRVSVAVRHGRKVKVEAISGADVVEKRSNLVQLMRKLFERVMKWDEKLIYTGVKDDSLPPDVYKALDDYLAESNSKLLVIYPLRDEREKESKRPPRSGLMMESFDPATSPEQLMARLEVVGKHAVGALYNAVEHKRIPMRFIWGPLAKVQEGLGGKARAITALVIAAVVALAAILTFVPYPLKMDATGQVLPEIRRWVFAPQSGEIRRIDVKPSDHVSPDEPLIDMFDQDLSGTIRRLKTEIETADNTIRNLESSLGGKVSDEAKLEYLKEQVKAMATLTGKKAELHALLERTNASDSTPGAFTLNAPLFPANGPGNDAKWEVLNYDFLEHLSGRPVRPSDPLLRLGYVDGTWEIELKIPQKHIGQVLAAFDYLTKQTGKEVTELDVDMIFKSDPIHTYRGKLARNKIAALATPHQAENANENEPVVLASVRLSGDDIPADKQAPRDPLYVTGTEVHAKILCGNHRMGYSLFYGVWEFFYEKVVFFF